MRPLLTTIALLTVTLAAPVHAQSPSTKIAPCTAAQLSIALDNENGFFDGMSHSGTLLVLRNLGPSACTVPARPLLTFEDAAHHPVSISLQTPRGMHPGPVLLPVVIPVNAEVTGSMRWVSSDAYGAGNCVSPAVLTLHLDPAASDADTLRTSFRRRLCGPAHRSPSYSLIPLHRDPVYTPVK